MNCAVMKAGSLIVAFLILLSGIATITGNDQDLQASEDRGITSGFRVGTPNRGSQRVNGPNGHTSIFVDEPVAILVGSDEAVELLSPSPRGDPGSGWTYDILISDQAWNQYNDGFQSMEVDPTNQNDIYVVYESWTDFATGTDQWCLIVRRSTNGGETWSPEIWVFSFPSQINGVYPDMKEADIAISNTGMIWVTYTVFAYDGPSRNIIDMQIFTQYMTTPNWGTGPWTSEIVTDLYGGAYNYHRLPTVAVHQPTNTPIITAMSYDAIAATQSSLVAWQPGATEWDGYEILETGPVNANYVQYPCMDSGSSYLYVTAMNYYEAGGVFDMRIWRSTDGAITWTALTDIYDPLSIYSFYKPSIASTKSGTDIVMCAATYTNNPSDQSLGDIAYAYSLNGGGTWDSYTIPQANYQRMPYVEEGLDKDYFMMTYRQEDGGPVYSTRIIFADTSDLTSWYAPETVSDTGAHQASNWFAHVVYQERPDGSEYPCVCWSDLRDAASPITETSDTYIVYSTNGARYTIDTDPTGLDVIVDSQTYTAPQLFNWPTGYEHYLEAPDPQNGGGGEIYRYEYWTDGGAITHSMWSTTVDNTITAHYLELFQYTIPLHEGWNLISLPLLQLDGSLNTVLANIAGKWDYVMAYNSTLPEEWVSNSIYRPDQLDLLNSLDHKMGFWINVTTTGVDLVVEGVDTSTTMMLYAGWNLVGYPSLTQTSIALALMGTGADAVEGFDAVEPYRLTPLAGSYMMTPGEGYWVHVPADTTWTVNW